MTKNKDNENLVQTAYALCEEIKHLEKSKRNHALGMCLFAFITVLTKFGADVSNDFDFTSLLSGETVYLPGVVSLYFLALANIKKNQSDKKAAKLRNITDELREENHKKIKEIGEIVDELKGQLS